MKTLEERVWEKVDKSGDCWLWTGHIDRRGYGKQFWGGISTLAHRAVYQIVNGPIDPPDLTVDHICFTTNCVRPDHLQLLTRSENSRKQRRVAEPLCPNGHERNEKNTYVTDERRRCRPCNVISAKQYRERKKGIEMVNSEAVG